MVINALRAFAHNCISLHEWLSVRQPLPYQRLLSVNFRVRNARLVPFTSCFCFFGLVSFFQMSHLGPVFWRLAQCIYFLLTTPRCLVQFLPIQVVFFSFFFGGILVGPTVILVSSSSKSLH